MVAPLLLEMQLLLLSGKEGTLAPETRRALLRLLRYVARPTREQKRDLTPFHEDFLATSSGDRRRRRRASERSARRRGPANG
jgi:hypothetical protein